MNGLRYPVALTLILLAFLFVFVDTGPASVYERELAGGAWDDAQWTQLEATLDFLNGAAAPPFYTADEASHLVDVQRLLRIAWALLICFATLSIVIALLARRRWTRIEYARELEQGGSLAAAAILLLALLAANFSAFWLHFHEVLFPQGNWQFPPDSALITLFPESFFQAFVLNVIGAALALSIVTILAAQVIKAHE